MIDPKIKKLNEIAEVATVIIVIAVIVIASIYAQYRYDVTVVKQGIEESNQPTKQ